MQTRCARATKEKQVKTSVEIKMYVYQRIKNQKSHRSSTTLKRQTSHFIMLTRQLSQIVNFELSWKSQIVNNKVKGVHYENPMITSYTPINGCRFGESWWRSPQHSELDRGQCPSFRVRRKKTEATDASPTKWRFNLKSFCSSKSGFRKWCWNRCTFWWGEVWYQVALSQRKLLLWKWKAPR